MDDKELGKTEKQEGLTRRSFLKILGTSLLSHFVFLNLSKKSWAASTQNSRPLGDDDCPDKDKCGISDASGDSRDVLCNTKISVPDECGRKSALGGITPDGCSPMKFDPDKCGQKDAKGEKIPDLCNPPDDPDLCEPPGDPVEDLCEPSYVDKCGKMDEKVVAIPDFCKPPDDPDKG